MFQSHLHIVSKYVSQYTLQQKFSEAVFVELQVEEVGLQPSSELSTRNGGWAEMSWKRIPDSWSCDVETASANLGPRPGTSMSPRWAERRFDRPAI